MDESTESPFCIYCGKHVNNLTDEHIIPSGLGGTQVLPHASCSDCQRLTTTFEQYVLRQSYGFRESRSFLKIGKRRPKEKPTDATIQVETKRGTVERTVPLHLHVLPFVLPLFDGPSALSDGVIRRNICVVGYCNYTLMPKLTPLLNHLGETQATIKIKVRHYDYAFSKMLAKIAWALWVSEFGVKHLSELWLPNAIIGTDQAIGKYVGTFDYAVAGQNAAPCLHSVYLSVLKHERGMIACARIQLFLQVTPTPTYIVLIGRIRDDVKISEELFNWYLPAKGMNGIPLTNDLPRFRNISFLEKIGKDKTAEILAEFSALGLALNHQSDM